MARTPASSRRESEGGAGDLAEYSRKRDPAKTPEPMGATSGAAGPTSRFVIQEHHARSLHWDLRLERNGVLASWALPKGLPDTPRRNHLAVHTEDHPLEYATFEGEIPRGEYGAGRMFVWDSGHYETEKWTDTEVKFALHGSRVSGRFVLFQTKDRNWMIHRHAGDVDTDELPDKVQPMLAVAGDFPADDAPWAFEVKWDGIRAILFVEGGRVRARSRNDLELTHSFPELAAVGEYLGMTSCILDGELVALGADGRPSFSRLQHRMQVKNQRDGHQRSTAEPITFVAFDLLYLGGHSLIAAPYDERRTRLESLHLSGSSFITTECFRDVPGRDVLAAVTANGLEGVVAKRRDSPYRPGRRHPDWTKVKAMRTQEVVLAGWTDGRGERADSFGALLLGIPEDGALHYAGKVGTGFSTEARRALLAELRSRATDQSPLALPLPSRELRGAHFVRPELVGEVTYGEWTTARRLRHPVWRGLRPDKSAADVVVEHER